MKFFDRRRLINAMLVASVLLNVGIIAYLARSGGLRRIFVKMDLAELPRTQFDFQKETEARYRKLPNTGAEIDFVGDSLVGDGPWSEFFSEVHNRGIGAQRASAVLDRIDEVTEGKPRKVFLLVGTNDLAGAVPDAQFLRHYRALLGRIRKESPETAITVIGILPINETFTVTFDNARVLETNRRLKELVAEFPGVRFLDLTPSLVDDKGNLRREFTTDGMHLNIDGYLAIREPLKGPVTEGDSRTKPPEETPRP